MTTENIETDCEAPLPRNSGAKTKRIELGLAILSATATPGAMYTPEEIACFCDCTTALIMDIEARALRKMRTKILAKFGIDLVNPADLRRWLALNLRS
jgi:hypothetical protein